MNQQHHQILVIEDDQADQDLMRTAVDLSQQPVTLQFLNHVQDLNEWLSQLARGEVCLPALILLDLNLPMQTGHEILKALRQDNLLPVTPIIVFCTSKAPDDILTSYQLGCNSYVCKPTDWPTYCKVIAAIIEFWLGFVKLPQEEIR